MSKVENADEVVNFRTFLGDLQFISADKERRFGPRPSGLHFDEPFFSIFLERQDVEAAPVPVGLADVINPGSELALSGLR
ncbi:hypothetical protein Q8Z05_14765 [Arthrobacter oryzae]|nr:hypothetical protein [Arthrobacter oryzae]WLQ05383.1 hypothetical protein Q8Z05_14765 [Arthrobacter oryzae]